MWPLQRYVRCGTSSASDFESCIHFSTNGVPQKKGCMFDFLQSMEGQRRCSSSTHVKGSSVTGMDNVRNMTGSPIAGIDPHELLDVRPLNYGALTNRHVKPVTSRRLIAFSIKTSQILACSGHVCALALVIACQLCRGSS